ncbi:MAG TPA: ABC transporter permease subunit [Pseudonocardiaceae bacterium]|nr:ABC transporter permease subunit [Pseudonocardiaceae bacterium]
MSTPVSTEIAPAVGPTDTQAGQGGSRRLLRSGALKVGAGVLLLLIWQFGVRLFAPSYIATPLHTVQRIPAVFADVQFGADVQTTLLAILEGLGIAVVIGTVLGLVMGRLPDLNRVLGMYVGTFYAMPLIAVVPLLTVWFGYTPTARLAMVVLEAVLPIIYNVAEGARLVPTTFLDVTRIHHAPWWRVWLGVVLPNALPYVLAGLDLAIGRALIGAVVAEFVTAIPGLGYYILFNVRSFHENEAMVALLVLVAFALALRALINLAIARGLRWYRPA